MAAQRHSVFLGIFLCLAIAVKHSEQKTITLDDILARTYSAGGFGGTWISDDELQYSSGMNTLAYNVITNTSRVVFDADAVLPEYQNYPGASLTASADGQYFLITYARRSLWRSSFLAKYVVINKDTKVVHQVGPADAELQLVRWSPVENTLVYVFENNVYLKRSASDATATQLTNDGTLNGPISNGHTDWVYEEEMFGTGNAIWFSPNGNHVAFVKFDDSLVHDFEYAMYGEAGNRETVYPRMVHIRYPKSGQINPIATVYVVDLNNIIVPQTLKYPADDIPQNRHYIASVSWRSGNELVVVHLNRRQQISTWLSCAWQPNGADGYICSQIWMETETAGWIDANSARYSADGNQILTLSSAKTAGTTESYRHIVKINATGAFHILPGFHVDSILGWDEENEQIYFSGTGRGNPSEAQAYAIPDEPPSAMVRCITCYLQNSNGETCQANSASFSTQFTHFLHSCSGPGIPETAFRLTAQTGTVKHVWTKNDVLREDLRDVEVPTFETFFNIPLAGGAVGRAKLFLPPNFDSTKKYPLMIDVYGGPDSQNIRYGFGFNWGTSLASDKNVIYGYIDGRGSGRQTREHLFQLNDKLGSVEIEDQIAATKWLIDNTNYIDPDRTAIWGWSYGGYATAMVMATDTTGVFKCGISVAPVTSWLYYDTIYTERYMGTPTENDGNYNKSEVTTQVENLRNKQFFLVHGNADDNVHYQQSMILSRALEQADIMFYQLSYPDEAHGINGPGMNRHLYHSLEKFLFRDCFAVPEPSTPSPTTTTTTTPGTSSPPNTTPTTTAGPTTTTTAGPTPSTTTTVAPVTTTTTVSTTPLPSGAFVTISNSWLTGVTISILMALRR